ncbi:MAG: acetylornithine transaminase [Lactobacillaceae bacterium]|jgi:acetylornithine aminotransferase|nr:acetylornithine transaminase [Lactobacillaceae bacterium]
MSNLIQNYARQDLEFVDGHEATLITANGAEYLDLTSGIGVWNLGLKHPVLVEALQEQVNQIWHVPNLYTSALQEKVAGQLSLNGTYQAFFCNSGTEANEAAIKLARLATGKTKVVSFINGFHGRTYGSMSITAQEAIQAGFAPLVPDMAYLAFNQVDFSAIDAQTAAVFVEIIQGEGGVTPADASWLKALAARCQTVGALLVVDEVQTGIGRCGSLYAFEQFGLNPEIVTVAKALGNGVPVGAMLAKPAVAKAFTPGTHGSTYGGNRLALAVATEVLALVDDPAFLASVATKGTLAMTNLTTQLADVSIVKDVRGIGLMLGIELTDAKVLNAVVEKLAAQHILVLTAKHNTLRLLPPLVISEAELTAGVQAVIDVIKEMDVK